MRVFGLWNFMVIARACAADRHGYVDCSAVWMIAAVEQFKECAFAGSTRSALRLQPLKRIPGRQ
jgi:hypothetical protein